MSLSPASAALIARIQSLPKTHRVVTTFADGRTRHHDTHSAAAAHNYAIGESRKIGRALIDRTSGNTVCVISVDILPIEGVAK